MENDQSLTNFLEEIGSRKGVGGYIYHTVLAVIHVWLRYQDNYEKAVQEIIKAGGDTDTSAAILGAIIGAKVGEKGIPKGWIEEIVEYPKTISWMKRLSLALYEKKPAPSYPMFLTPFRNPFFFIIILFHGIRRLFPPY